jgi:hypothetical protein
MTVPVPPAANWIRLAGGSGAAVGGTEVGGTEVGGTAVGGIDVTVTIAGVGGADVLVASAATPVVEVGTADSWLVTVGGLPLAGNLQAVAANASITSSTQVKINFLFMVASLAPNANIPMMIFYIIL